MTYDSMTFFSLEMSSASALMSFGPNETRLLCAVNGSAGQPVCQRSVMSCCARQALRPTGEAAACHEYWRTDLL